MPLDAIPLHSSTSSGATTGAPSTVGADPTAAGTLVPGVVSTRADEVESQLCELAALIHAANADLMRLLAEFDQLGGWVGVGIRSIGHWAAINLGIDARTAARQATAGRRLAELPAIAAACAAGEIGWAKARVLADVAEPATDERWLGLAREMSVTQLVRCARAYRRAEDTDHPDRLDNARERRGIWLFDEPDGLVRVTGLLEPDDAAVLRAALAAQGELLWRDRTAADDSADPIEKAEPSERGEPAGRAGPAEPTEKTEPSEPAEPAEPAERAEPAEPAECPEPAGSTERADRPEGADRSGDTDRRGAERAQQSARPSEIDPTLTTRDTAATRRADALVALARTALAAGPVPDDADDRTQVVLHVDAAAFAPGNQVARSHLEHGPPVPTPTAERLACDATIHPLVHRAVDEAVDLAFGRTQRLVNRAQRRALRTRDGNGCAFPGCAATRHLHAHHIVHWTRGGATDLDNLVLLCRHHHRLHHEGGYHITMINRRPRFHRSDGTPLQPPPTTATARPTAQLRHRTHRRGHTPTPNTPRAHSGGAPHWSPQRAIDALAS
ncbi:MAG TPA: DUF222 domain-containing protein [Acidimicrobiales bacterium]